MGKEVEMKIPMNLEQVKSCIQKVFNSGVGYQLICKSDEYYKARFDRVVRIPKDIIRIRNNTIITDEILNDVNLSVEDYFLGDNFGICIGRSKLSNPGHATVTYKKRFIEHGIESNVEDEIDNPHDALIASEIIKQLGSCWYKKMKKCISIPLWNFDNTPSSSGTIDIDNINGRYFFEIECTNPDLPTDQAIDKLETLIKDWGLNPNDRDGRTWVEIIKEYKDMKEFNVQYY